MGRTQSPELQGGYSAGYSVDARQVTIPTEISKGVRENEGPNVLSLVQ